MGETLRTSNSNITLGLSNAHIRSNTKISQSTKIYNIKYTNIFQIKYKSILDCIPKYSKILYQKISAKLDN